MVIRVCNLGKCYNATFAIQKQFFDISDKELKALDKVDILMEHKSGSALSCIENFISALKSKQEKYLYELHILFRLFESSTIIIESKRLIDKLKVNTLYGHEPDGLLVLIQDISDIIRTLKFITSNDCSTCNSAIENYKPSNLKSKLDDMWKISRQIEFSVMQKLHVVDKKLSLKTIDEISKLLNQFEDNTKLLEFHKRTMAAVIDN